MANVINTKYGAVLSGMKPSVENALHTPGTARPKGLGVATVPKASDYPTGGPVGADKINDMVKGYTNPIPQPDYAATSLTPKPPGNGLTGGVSMTAPGNGSTGGASQANTTSIPQLNGATTVNTNYILGPDRYNAMAQAGHTFTSKAPSMAEFMAATGLNFKDAASLMGIGGTDTDLRDWEAIMSSPDVLRAATAATRQLLSSGSHSQFIKNRLERGGAYTALEDRKDQKVVARSGNFAFVNQGTTRLGQPINGLTLVDGGGHGARFISMDPESIKRAVRLYGLDPTELYELADQLDAAGVKYKPGDVYAGSDFGVDLRQVAAEAEAEGYVVNSADLGNPDDYARYSTYGEVGNAADSSNNQSARNSVSYGGGTGGIGGGSVNETFTGTSGQMGTGGPLENVEQRVRRLVDEDSPMMRQARTQGMQFGNSRGMLNSSMTAEAAQDAAYKAAIPIASQDASMQLEMIMQANQISLADRQQIRQIQSTEGQGAAERALQEKLANLDVSSREKLATMDIDARKIMQQWDTASRLELAKMDVGSRKDMQAVEIAYNTSKDLLGKYLAELGNDTEQQRVMASYMVSQEQIYSARLSDIMGNTNLTAEQRDQQVKAAKDSFTGHLDAISNILSVDVTEFMLWDDAIVGATA